MNIAIISDTHDNLKNLGKTLNIIKKEKIRKIIHCGDICKFSSLEFLSRKFKGEIFLTLGNAEINKKEIKENANKLLNVKLFEGSGALKFNGVNIRFSHLQEITDNRHLFPKEDFFFYGHTHRPSIQKVKSITFVNPGNLAGWVNPPTFAILDTKTRKIRFIFLSRF